MNIRPPSLSAIFHQQCPRCRQAPIFRRPILRGPLAMHNHCPLCGLHFEREGGYFLGAMYVSFLFTIGVVTALVMGLWLGAGWTYEHAMIGALLAYLPFVPFILRYSRVIWIHIDQTFDPE